MTDMSIPPIPSETLYPIAAVERDTGLSKDVLRVWERRYGFPSPLRDAHGERVYTQEQLEKLRLLRLLIDHGKRPGNIIGLSTTALADMVARDPDTYSPPEPVAGIIDALLAHDVERFRSALLQQLMRQGLQRFVTETVTALNYWIGNAWLRGRLAIFDEHLYSEHVQNILRNAILDHHARGSAPRVLLTSLPGERHRIGLLMVEAMLTTEGAACVALGTETPPQDIRQAVDAYAVDVVALSFSAAVPQTVGLTGLTQIRQMLPASVGVWAGGAGISRCRRPPPGVEILDDFEALQEAVYHWRTANPGTGTTV